MAQLTLEIFQWMENYVNDYRGIMMLNNYFQIVLVVSASCILSGCATIGREQDRAMNHAADHTLAGMLLEHQELQSKLSLAPGYLVVERSGSGIPMFGKRGKGIMTDTKTGDRVAVRLLELEIDGAWGLGDYSGLYLFRSKEDFEQAMSGQWSAEDAGTIFVTAGGQASVEYIVEKITIAPN
ncbi:hypothetical protein [Pontiella agarivorans]|uniref:Uncharacterized protein n=1 Tax=Pontiella agarivorans TaxID=3038953 RepID=A0ABU5MYG5_9BACT|nr:hypothetical protein [Pontiella agarivorans]MDZ8119260.1 hypothetical protein [Pontiella agarivorans]